MTAEPQPPDHQAWHKKAPPKGRRGRQTVSNWGLSIPSSLRTSPQTGVAIPHLAAQQPRKDPSIRTKNLCFRYIVPLPLRSKGGDCDQRKSPCGTTAPGGLAMTLQTEICSLFSRFQQTEADQLFTNSYSTVSAYRYQKVSSGVRPERISTRSPSQAPVSTSTRSVRVSVSRS